MLVINETSLGKKISDAVYVFSDYEKFQKLYVNFLCSQKKLATELTSNILCNLPLHFIN